MWTCGNVDVWAMGPGVVATIPDVAAVATVATIALGSL